ncbi:transposase [Bradyrhizobium vignae]|uniref:Transposase n=1 Tax=Bradyrhizobium vignae TaxID=1549949 RepID=A0A2U3PYA6_9BRAD|nr:transposase [Bradyrhizobium vignae]
MMDRLVLSDAAWERMAPLIIGRPDQKGSTGRENRMFVEGVLGSCVRAHPGAIFPIVRARQHAAGAKKGGLKIRRLAARAAA